MLRRGFIGIAFVLLSSGAAFSQTGSPFAVVPAVVPADKLPEFDVADIQESKESGNPRARFLPGGKVEFQALPMKFMILAAWGYENDEGRIEGGPAWMSSVKFDIVAKAPHDAGIPTLRLMLRSLLIKRFGLESHIEQKVLPVYALVRGKGEPKVTASAKQGEVNCSRSVNNGVITAACHNMTMDELAGGLRGMAPAYIDQPVVNLTELQGQYDFTLGWSPRGLVDRAAGRGSAADGGPPPAGADTSAEPGSNGITMFEAIGKDLGLKLESTKHVIPIVVVDKVNRTATFN